MKSKNSKCIVILQVRMDSSRFPNKVMSEINGKPMLWHIIERIKQIGYEIVVATTKRKIDDEIINVAKSCNVKSFRGSANDVLDRFYKASLKFDAKVIVRMTADNPLVDPRVSKKVVKKFQTGKFDYVSTDDKSFTTGLSTECFSFDILKKMWEEASSKPDREHVTSFILKNSKDFKISFIKCRDKRVRNYRLTVDYPEDLHLVKEIYSRLYIKNKVFSLEDVINLLEKETSLVKINNQYNMKGRVE